MLYARCRLTDKTIMPFYKISQLHVVEVTSNELITVESLNHQNITFLIMTLLRVSTTLVILKGRK